MHQHGQGENAVRARLESGYRHDAARQPDRGARAFDGNPYDGHTLAEQIEQATILMQDTGAKPRAAWVDRGYRGVDDENLEIEIKHRGKKTRVSEREVRTLKRRQAIEQMIGHLKSDHRMGRCHPKGALGDTLHAVQYAAG